MPTPIAFTGGGTAGHINPGLAVAEELASQAPDASIFWIGNKKGMDRGIVERAGLPFYGISSGKLRRDLSLKNLADAFRVLGGFFQARKILKKTRPALLFSKGGFVSVPPCLAAKSLGIPVFTHESDFTPGLATRINARSAQVIFTAYEETVKGFPEAARSKILRVGNPIRRAIYQGDAKKGGEFLRVSPNVPVVLVLGGSQGAAQVNDIMASIRDELKDLCFVAHQTGENKGLERPNDDRYLAFPYLHEELPDVIARADVIVGRSGAGTLWECASLGKPLVLIPLASAATRGDQVVNADYFVKIGAARMFAGADATGANVLAALRDILQSEKTRNAMRDAALSLTKVRAAQAIAEELVKSLNGNKGGSK
jgi:UDP-N-acetylglucosamine--N-acetylmuramyl-(pentapeptide) pyrophosphoryl-undecaprenol N-acetylglucosamine transferase